MNNTSRGWLADLISSISNDLANNSHLIETYTAELRDFENAKIAGEETEELEQRLSQLELVMNMVLETRRAKMNLLKENATSYNPKMWCSVKHAIESFMQASEVWQASPSKETLELMVKTKDIMASVLSMMMGHTFEVCSACYFDQLKVKE